MGNELSAPKSGHIVQEQSILSILRAVHLLCAKHSSSSDTCYSVETIMKKLSSGCWPC